MDATIDRLAVRFPQLRFCGRVGAATESLTPEEKAATSGYVAKRVEEFALGRECARHALRSLGVGACSLLPHADGGVAWPAGVVGSISHKRSGCVAVVGQSASLTGVGIDLEWADRSDSSMIDRITTLRERTCIAAIAQRYESSATVFFACKEAVYKAQFRVHRRELDWGDVEIEFDDEQPFFRVRTADAWSLRMRGAVEKEGNWITALAFEDALARIHV